MAILNFQKPDKVIMNASTDKDGQFEFRPLEPGYGLTVGNALRRVLLSGLEGFALTSLRIDGVDHEFSTIEGVVEDVTEIVLNLKQVRFKQQIESVDTETVKFSVSGKEQLLAGDLAAHITSFQVLNPDLVICNMDASVNLSIEVVIEKGRGYVGAEVNKKADAPIGTIALDSIYTPIKNVKYSIENYRVEQKTDFEKLVMEVTSDGSIHPEEALKEAAKILIGHFVLFSDENIMPETKVSKVVEEVDETFLQMRKILKTPLADLDLSVRAYNCLKAAEIKTLGELVNYHIEDLLKFRNFGKKSLSELEEFVRDRGLHFGMDVAKYNLNDD